MDVIPWLVVAGDFTPLGGMDVANHRLARYLATRGEVHLVTHRAWPDLVALPGVHVHQVARPWNSHALGSVWLARRGRAVWRELEPRGVRTIVNGGNCELDAVNWVHYVHAAHEPMGNGSSVRRLKARLLHRRDVSAERRALHRARLVVCNSRRTKSDVVEHVGIEPSRVHVVYYGSDAIRFSIVTADARVAARDALDVPRSRRLVGFIGALGDRRKAFDTVFAAWFELCRDPNWDADLLVVGAGSDQLYWRQRTHAAGLEARIRFAGFRHDVPEYIAALDVLIHPARYEAYGLSVHEALCRGVPAIVSRSAGVAEQYPADMADLLIDNPDDAGEVVDRLRTWRRHAEVYQARVLPFARTLHQRTWEMMAADIAALAERAAGA